MQGVLKGASWVCWLVMGVGVLSPRLGHAQGALTPPGAPAPSMRSLDQIYSELSKLTPANPLVLGTALSPTTQGVIHMTASGQKQGQIKGESTVKGLENSIVCIDFSHSIVSPRDAATGLPTGKRQHKPLQITKYIDRTSPLFYTALINNENLTTVELKFFQNDAKGSPTNYFKITLTNANVSRQTNSYPNLEGLEFTYQKIEWEHVPSGNIALDTWQSL
jgi:type VI secretion system secreted protein Hcp